MVSVVIPCYNHGQYIDEAVESIFKQTYQNFEIIIVNDGSIDDYTNIKLRNYVKPRTRVLHIPNGGPSVARNTGIKAAKGEYVLVLDADDFFDSAFLDKAVGILDQRKEIGVITCAVQCFGDSSRTWYPKGGDVESFLLENNCASGALFRIQCWKDAGGYGEDMKKGYEDWDFWVAVTKKGWMVHSISEPLLFHRVSMGSRDYDSNNESPEAIKRIVENHQDVFGKYMINVIYGKDKVISALRNQVEEMSKLTGIESSTSYKIGRLILLPFTFVKDSIRRRKRKSSV